MKASLQGIHPVLAAGNVADSVRFYRDIGFALLFQDSAADPKYAVVERDKVQLHIQWADATQWAYPVDRPVYRFLVSDVDAIYAEFVGSGRVGVAATPATPLAVPANTPWNTREFHLHDPGRNGLQFYRPL